MNSEKTPRIAGNVIYMTEVYDAISSQDLIKVK